MLGLLFEYVLSMIFYSVWLLALYLRNRYNVIHIHNMPDFLVFAAAIPKLMGAKLILDIHDPMPEFYTSRFKTSSGSAFARLMRFQERASAWFANAVVTANPNFKRNLVARGIPAKKVLVITNQPDPRIFNRERYRAELQTDRSFFTLIYPGTIAPRYGLDIAIRAVPVLSKHIPNLQLQIIGSRNACAEDLEKLAVELGVTDQVKIQPAVPIDEVPRLMALADVGIYPALPDAHMSIAIPGKVIEYAVMGLPVVSTRLQVLEEIFSDDSILYFEPGHVDQFSALICDLYTRPAKRTELVTHADRDMAEKYSWNVERDKYLSLIELLT